MKYGAAVGGTTAYYIFRHAAHAINIARSGLIGLGMIAEGAVEGGELGSPGGPWGVAGGAFVGLIAGGMIAYTEGTGKTTIGADTLDDVADQFGCP